MYGTSFLQKGSQKDLIYTIGRISEVDSWSSLALSLGLFYKGGVDQKKGESDPSAHYACSILYEAL